jgi:hypothetical protein
MNPGGARAAAKASPVGVQTVVQLLADLGDLLKAGRVKSVPGMAVWVLQHGKRKVDGIAREARQLRGESARRRAVAAPPPPDRWQGTPQELEEMAQDYRDLLPPEALARVQGGADRAGGGLAVFCRLAAEALRMGAPGVAA